MASDFERRLEEAARDMRERLLAHPVEGRWQELANWNPLPAARVLADSIGTGRWEDRSRLNVPGPFYAGETDDGQNGPYYLPDHVLSSDEGHEFVYRRPANPREMAGLVETYTPPTWTTAWSATCGAMCSG